MKSNFRFSLIFFLVFVGHLAFGQSQGAVCGFDDYSIFDSGGSNPPGSGGSTLPD